MGADVKGAIFSIVTEIVTPKALGEGGCGLATDRDVMIQVGAERISVPSGRG